MHGGSEVQRCYQINFLEAVEIDNLEICTSDLKIHVKFKILYTVNGKKRPRMKLITTSIQNKYQLNFNQLWKTTNLSVCHV